MSTTEPEPDAPREPAADDAGWGIPAGLLGCSVGPAVAEWFLSDDLAAAAARRRAPWLVADAG